MDSLPGDGRPQDGEARVEGESAPVPEPRGGTVAEAGLDPAAVEGPDEVRYRAFEQVALQLVNRIRYLLILLEREQGRKEP